MQNKNLELGTENSVNSHKEKKQVGPSDGSPDNLQQNEVNLDKDGKGNNWDKYKAREDSKWGIFN